MVLFKSTMLNAYRFMSTNLKILNVIDSFKNSLSIEISKTIIFKFLLYR